MKDTYQTLATVSEGEYKEKGSKFIAYAYPIDSVEEVKQHLTQLKKDHLKARHHCYAYRLGLEGLAFRANDDGEPSGTAGRPILGQIDSFGLSNVLIVVVRYFGGTKLGTSGLKRAYKDSSKEALQNGSIIEKIVEKQFIITYDYIATPKIMNYLKKENFTILDSQYHAKAVLTVSIRLTDIANFEKTIGKIVGAKLQECSV